jgi:hypothetical protein
MPKQIQLTRKHKEALTAFATGSQKVIETSILADLEAGDYINGADLTSAGRKAAAALLTRLVRKPKDGS